jgi:branched-subunit amino acid aminotransferase/4-amino-4-deoxychorismate lyase
MNELEFEQYFWHNGTIYSLEKRSPFLDFNIVFSLNLTDCFYTSGTDILFYHDTLYRILTLIKIYNIETGLFSDKTGETFKSETKRLLIRNKYYKTGRCYYLACRNTKNGNLDEYIFVVADPQLFENDKIIFKTMVSNRFLKPPGAVMNLPTIEYEFRKIILAEIKKEKADDCIILNHDQYITETYLGNIFLIMPGEILTPSLNSGCTNSLLRIIVMKIFNQINQRVLEINDLQVENLFAAKEVIIAGETGVYSMKGIEYKRFFDTTRKMLISKIIESGRD